MKKKIVKSKKRVPKFKDGGVGTLKPKTALEAAKDLKINPTIATAQTLEEQTASAKDLLKGLMRPPIKEVTATAPTVSTPKSVAAKNSKTVSDSYKKSLQGLIDKGNKSIDDLVELGYGTKQGLTNLGLTAPKKATAPKPTAPKKATTPKPSAPKKGGSPKPLTPKEKSQNKTTDKKSKDRKVLKLDTKKIKSSDELAKSNYGNNIIGDLIGGPLKGAVAVGAAAYGLYKAGKIAKNLSNVGKAFTKSVATKAAKAGGSQVAANTARKIALAKSSKQFANKRALQTFKNLSKERTLTQAAKKSFSNTARLTKEKLGKEFSKSLTENAAKNAAKNAVSKDIAKRTAKKTAEASKKDLAESFAKKLATRKAKEAAKDASKKGTQKLLGPGQKMLPAPKGSGQLKFNFRKGGKITKTKRGGKKC